MLERRAAVNKVVLTIQKEQRDAGGEVWDKHTNIDKFLQEVEDREDLKEMLEAGGATINDMRLRLEHLRYFNEVIKITKLRNGFLMRIEPKYNE